LEQAIQTQFGSDAKLLILIEDASNETPAEANARLERERQKAAESSVNNDPTVKSLMDTFNASVDQDSIQPQ
jgi:DNA polymerase-3 subunit gamma/tau